MSPRGLGLTHRSTCNARTRTAAMTALLILSHPVAAVTADAGTADLHRLSLDHQSSAGVCHQGTVAHHSDMCTTAAHHSDMRTTAARHSDMRTTAAHHSDMLTTAARHSNIITTAVHDSDTHTTTIHSFHTSSRSPAPVVRFITF